MFWYSYFCNTALIYSRLVGWLPAPGIIQRLSKKRREIKTKWKKPSAIILSCYPFYIYYIFILSWRFCIFLKHSSLPSLFILILVSSTKNVT